MEKMNKLLDRMESNTLPSKRCNRLVDVGMLQDVLELRDPNDSSSAEQFVLAGGVMWSRMLPPEYFSEPQWIPMDARSNIVISEYSELANNHDVAMLSRERFYYSGSDKCHFIIGEETSTDRDRDICIPIGPISISLYAVPLPPCPDCGGELLWFEAGYVPGTRKCANGCGSFFRVSSSTRFDFNGGQS